MYGLKAQWTLAIRYYNVIVLKKKIKFYKLILTVGITFFHGYSDSLRIFGAETHYQIRFGNGTRLTLFTQSSI